MERVGILIDKLKEQFAQQAETDSLLATVEMIMLELQQQKNAPSSNSAVSVMDLLLNNSRMHSISMTNSLISKSNQKKNTELSGWLFDINTSLPVVEDDIENKKNEFATGKMELNDLIKNEAFSINDQLKQREPEVAHGFNETPIRDLKKAIGINDRYLFINELFRGDEIMYERSLKTINGFNIFPEAQYWIERELKLKLGWNNDSIAVEHFDQLVKRRFS
ncbi:MAG: hypothetical protein WCJ80_08250 [Bacteroidota bacterium]|jgi:hypothetical protein